MKPCRGFPGLVLWITILYSAKIWFSLLAGYVSFQTFIKGWCENGCWLRQTNVSRTMTRMTKIQDGKLFQLCKNKEIMSLAASLTSPKCLPKQKEKDWSLSFLCEFPSSESKQSLQSKLHCSSCHICLALALKTTLFQLNGGLFIISLWWLLHKNPKCPKYVLLIYQEFVKCWWALSNIS